MSANTTTAARMAQRLSFNAYCKQYSIGAAREQFHAWLVENHDHDKGDIRAAWDWEAHWQSFMEADQRNTHADALV